MEFWILLLVGSIIVATTSVMSYGITECMEERAPFGDGCIGCCLSEINKCKHNISHLSKTMQIIIYALVITSIVFVGGPVGGTIFYMTLKEEVVTMAYILYTIIFELLLYAAGYWFLGLQHFKSLLSQICFLAIFVIAIIGWTMYMLQR